MSLLDIDVSGAQEPKTMEAGSEVKIRIIDVRQDTDKNGNPYIMPRFDIVDEPLAKDFTDFMGLPHEGMDAKQKARNEYKIKSFLESFNLPTSGQLDPDEWKGLTGWAILGTSTDNTFGEQNTVRKYVVGK
jgi:hypothetical protein